MRVLVIGGTGFIGAPVARRLLDQGHTVATFHRGEPSGGTETIRGDRHELPNFAGAIRRFGPEVVLDTIAYTQADAAALMRVFRGLAQRVVVLSSQDVYAAYGRLLRLEDGPPEPAPMSEESPLRSSRFPHRSAARLPTELAHDYEKILVEEEVLGDGRLPATVLRLPCVYGPGDRWRRIREHLRSMDAGEPIIRLDTAKASWRWTRGYVENVADAIVLTVTDVRAAGRTYNLGEKDALTEADWVWSIGRAAGWRGEPHAAAREELPAERREPYDFAHDLVADTRRIRSELGYGERVGRPEALRRTVVWERTQPA